MDSLNYAAFDYYRFSEPERRCKVEREAELNKNKIERVQAKITADNLKELKSDYLNMSSYYYDERKDVVYEVDNRSFSGVDFFKPMDYVEEHIRELNGLKKHNITSSS